MRVCLRWRDPWRSYLTVDCWRKELESTCRQGPPKWVKQLAKHLSVDKDFTFLISNPDQRPCVYEAWLLEDGKLWFRIPHLTTSYCNTDRKFAADSGNDRISVALIGTATKIDVSMSIRVFEEMTTSVLSWIRNSLCKYETQPQYTYCPFQ